MFVLSSADLLMCQNSGAIVNTSHCGGSNNSQQLLWFYYVLLNAIFYYCKILLQPITALSYEPRALLSFVGLQKVETIISQSFLMLYCVTRAQIHFS